MALPVLKGLRRGEGEGEIATNLVKNLTTFEFSNFLKFSLKSNITSFPGVIKHNYCITNVH